VSLTTLVSTTTQTPTLIAQNSSWKYLDNGTNQGTVCKESSFSDSTWSTGNAELGYGDGDETTVVGYGSNSSAKYITTYFRKSFSVNDASSVHGLTLNLKRDDGAVVYLNGVEIARSNISTTGTISYTTLAPDASDDGKTWFQYSIPKTALVTGNNVLAVEIHQSSASSSDISFNLELLATSTTGTVGTTSLEYYFNQDYTGASLSGTGSTRQYVNWNILGATPYLADAYLWEYDSGYTDIKMLDNCDNGRRCLRLDTIRDNPNKSGTTRAQPSMNFKDVHLPMYRTSHRMYLSPDLANLKNIDGNIRSNGGWFTLWETWLSDTPNGGNPAGSSRISLAFEKDSAIGSPIFWKLKAERMQPSSEVLWIIENRVTPPIFGGWYTIDVTVVDGLESNGIVKIDITPDGGQKVNLFDVRNTTIYVDSNGVAYPEIYRQGWNAYKFYFGDTTLKWLEDRGYKAYALYNDFKWHKN